jgi:hypothetical protein
MTRKQKGTIQKTPSTSRAQILIDVATRDGVVPHPIVAVLIVAVRIVASSKWLSGDPPCERKVREINELPVPMQAVEPGATRWASGVSKKSLPCHQKIPLLALFPEPPHKRLRLTVGYARREK